MHKSRLSLDDHVGRLNTNDWRAPIYHDLILTEVERRPGPSTVLEIGCGKGFDNNLELQKSIAEKVSEFIGIEPDESVEPQPIFSNLIRASLEDSHLGSNSVDVAYSVMVMEHVDDADGFMHELARVLKPGGVYWGFTVDSRHWFTTVANILSHLRLKSIYLTLLNSAPRGEGRYLDYPTAYRLNSPDALAAYDQYFSSIRTWNVGPTESAGQYAPAVFRPLVNRLEAHRVRRKRPRTDFVVRLVK